MIIQPIDATNRFINLALQAIARIPGAIPLGIQGRDKEDIVIAEET